MASHFLGAADSAELSGWLAENWRTLAGDSYSLVLSTPHGIPHPPLMSLMRNSSLMGIMPPRPLWVSSSDTPYEPHALLATHGPHALLTPHEFHSSIAPHGP